MTTIVSFEILRWCAWAPTLNSLADWQSWCESSADLPEGPEKPPVQFLPAALRRRCSTMSRAALLATFSVLGPDELNSTPSIFASQHGESQTTIELLQALATDELLSPTSFGLSVHNTVSGLFSIAATNRCNSTALAAGPHVILAALLEAYSIQRACSKSSPVVCVFSDEPLFSALRTPRGKYPLVAISLLLGPGTNSSNQSGCSLELSTTSPPSQGIELDYATFLRWLLRSADDPLETTIHQTSWALRLRGREHIASRFCSPHVNTR